MRLYKGDNSRDWKEVESSSFANLLLDTKWNSCEKKC